MKPEVRWPLFIIGLLALQVLLGVFFVWKATSDPTFAVESNYYDKAVHWEDAQAQAQVNDELGWMLAESFTPAPVLGADPTLQISLSDAVGRPVTGAQVRVEAFHNVRADTVLRATLFEGVGGVYSAQLPMFRPGLWELRYTIDRAGMRFTHVSRNHLETRPR